MYTPSGLVRMSKHAKKRAICPIPKPFTTLLRRRQAGLAPREPDDPRLTLATHQLFDPELIRQRPAEGAQRQRVGLVARQPHVGRHRREAIGPRAAD
jgi:hypothetical protein